MPNVIYELPDGQQVTLDVQNGFSVMEAALRQGIQGIEAECGGCLSCATCHVLVDEAWTAKLSPMGEIEDEMLDLVVGRQGNSRLSCQLKMKPELDGIVVRIPENQIAA